MITTTTSIANQIDPEVLRDWLAQPDTLMPDMVFTGATERGVPTQRSETFSRLSEFGHGPARRRMHGYLTDLTGTIASRIARNKVSTKFVLNRAGIPVPAGPVVRTVDQAVEAATRIGYPIVIKPPEGAGSRGAFNDIDNEQELRDAYPMARSESPSGQVLVEQFIVGTKHKATIIDSKFVCVYSNEIPRVTGDGKHSVRELIDRENDDPRRAGPPRHHYIPMTFDHTSERLLQKSGLTLDAIPECGRVVPLQNFALVKLGATLIDRTHEIHPATIALLELAARTVGLPVATIDLITTDITRPLWESGGAVIEINSESALSAGYHLYEGPVYEFGAMILDMLYPQGETGRTPVIGITMSRDSPEICRAIATELAQLGKSAGMSTRSGIRIAGMHYTTLERSGIAGLQVLLNNPAVDVAIVEIPPDQFDLMENASPHWDLLVVPSLGEMSKAIGRNPRKLLDEVARIKIDQILMSDSDPFALALRVSGLPDHVEWYAGNRVIPTIVD